MAETLGTNDMLPTKFEGKRQYDWIFAIEGIDSFLMKTASRPSYTIAETVINYMNSKRYLAGKRTFAPLNVTLYDPIAPSGAQQVMEWIRTIDESVSGRNGYADFYKRDCQIKMTDPIGTVIELWDIKGVFPTSINYNSLNYDDDSTLMTIDLTLRFDNCILQF